jgi:putative SOS response-associated peptidase YedK
LARQFRLSDNRMAAVEPLAAIFPGHMAPIIKQRTDGERELVLRSWGLILLRDGYAPKRVTNTRDDKAQTKFWKGSFDNRRCLVPATAFCEPDEGKPARWHWFALKGDDERSLFAFAGLYRQWKGPVKKDGPNVDIEFFSFMTTLPNAAHQHDQSRAQSRTSLGLICGSRGALSSVRGLPRHPRDRSALSPAELKS